MHYRALSISSVYLSQSLGSFDYCYGLDRDRIAEALPLAIW